jgi:hypothetical protein
LIAASWGDKRRSELHDDRRGDIGHDAQRDEAHTLQRAAGEGVEDVEHAALRLRIERLQHRGIDARQRHVAQKAEHDQRANGKPDALLEFVAWANLAKLMFAAIFSAVDAIALSNLQNVAGRSERLSLAG